MLFVYVGRTSIHLLPTLWFWSFPSFRFLLLQHSGGGRHTDANWSPIFEDLYSLELVVCSSHRVSSILLDNDSALNVCPLATVVALGFAPSDFGPSTQIVRAYNNTQREVIGTLTIDLLIGSTTFSILFQIHQAGEIPFSLH
ncbi:hypothetical protein AAG906_014983 [Vitis piasezkii]